MKTIKFLLGLIILIAVSYLAIVCVNNKTFMYNIYVGADDVEIFVPKYSYFKDECCSYTASFYSLKSEEKLNNEINNYLYSFDSFENNSMKGYKKDNLFIQSYNVEDQGLYRTINITYDVID